MAVIGSIQIRMGADMRPLFKSFDSATARIGKFATSAQGLLLGAFAGVGVGAAIADAVQKASDFNETLSKTAIIFGPSADLIISKAKQMSAAFGADKNEFITAAGNFGAVFKGIGKSQEEAAKLGNTIATLGMDMAAFENTTNAEAFTALSSALRGEFDPIEKYRVFLSAARIEAKALEMGLAATKGEIDDTAKKTATLALITEQTADAQGNLAQTASEPASQFRALTGVLDNFKTTVGDALMPAITLATGGLIEFTKGIIASFEAWKEPISFTAESISAFVVNVNRSFAMLFKNLSAWGKWFSTNWVTLMTDDIRHIGVMISNLATGNWSDLSEGFEAKAPGPPAWMEADLITMNDLMAKRGQKIGETLKESIWDQGWAPPMDLGKSIWDQGAFVTEDWGKSIWDQGAFEKDMGESAVTVAKAVEERAPSATGFGTAAASEAIARQRNKAAGEDKPIKEIAKTGKESLAAQQRMAGALDQINSKLSAGSLAAYEIT